MGVNDVLLIATCHDEETRALFFGTTPVIEKYVKEKGYTLHYATMQDAIREVVEQSISLYRPIFISWAGHGTEGEVWGQNGEKVFNLTNAHITSGSIVNLIACLAGVTLAPKMVEKGAVAVFAYRDEVVIVTKEVYPLEFFIEEGFVESLTKPSIVLEGVTVGGAYYATIAEYNKWIDYWDERDPHVADVLRWDKGIFGVYGNKLASISLSNYATQKKVVEPLSTSVVAMLTLAITISALKSTFLTLIR